jgi:predicted RNA-binding Zn ribbon-like protein
MRRWCDMKACGNRAKVQRFRRKVNRAAGKSVRAGDD